jgi:TolA-binding protein
LVLSTGCEGKRRKRPPPNTLALAQRLEQLEAQTSSIQRDLNSLVEKRHQMEQMARRLEALEVEIERINRQPSASLVKENPLEDLPKPSEAGSSLGERRPPPDLPLAKLAQSPKKPDSAEGPSRPRGPVVVRERTAGDLFRLGVRHFEAGELSLAVDKLRLYLERSTDVKRADEALFIVGQAELARGRPLAAAESFTQLAAAFPQSPRRPEALYHGAEAYRRLYDKPQALKLWKELEERYPSHPLAPKAREAIRLMASER